MHTLKYIKLLSHITVDVCSLIPFGRSSPSVAVETNPRTPPSKIQSAAYMHGYIPPCLPLCLSFIRSNFVTKLCFESRNYVFVFLFLVILQKKFK